MVGLQEAPPAQGEEGEEARGDQDLLDAEGKADLAVERREDDEHDRPSGLSCGQRQRCGSSRMPFSTGGK
jgi:hypothetical protein